MQYLCEWLVFFVLSNTLSAQCDERRVEFDKRVQSAALSPDEVFAVVALEDYNFACVNLAASTVQWQMQFPGYDYQYGVHFADSNTVVLGRDSELVLVDISTGEELALVPLGGLKLEDAFLDMDLISMELSQSGFPRINNYVAVRFADSTVLVNIAKKTVAETWYVEFNEYALFESANYTFFATVSDGVQIRAFEKTSNDYRTIQLPSRIEDALEIHWIREMEGDIVIGLKDEALLCSPETNTLVRSSKSVQELTREIVFGVDSSFVNRHAKELQLENSALDMYLYATSLFGIHNASIAFRDIPYQTSLRNTFYADGDYRLLHMTASNLAKSTVFGQTHDEHAIAAHMTQHDDQRTERIVVSQDLTSSSDTAVQLHTFSVRVPPLFGEVQGLPQIFKTDSTTVLALQTGLYEVEKNSVVPKVQGRLSIVDPRSQGFGWVTSDSLVLFHDQQPLVTATQDSVLWLQHRFVFPEDLRGFVPTSWYADSQVVVLADARTLAVGYADMSSGAQMKVHTLAPPMGFDYTVLFRHRGNLMWNNSSDFGRIHPTTNEICSANKTFVEENEVLLLFSRARNVAVGVMRDEFSIVLF